MTKLSQHFHDSEFKCPCCDVTIVAEALVSKLQQLRDIINKPIKVTSGYRCKRENKKVGGSINSPHLLGEGADIQIKDISSVSAAMMAKTIENIRLGIYPRHLHIDIRPPNPSKYWLVKKYGQKHIYSKREKSLAKFLKNNL